MSRMPGLNWMPMCAMVAALASLLIAPLTAQAENSVVVGVVGGQRFTVASDVRFDSAITVEGVTYQIGTALLRIDDASGTNAGWTVTVGLPVADDPQAEHATAGMVLIDVSAPAWVAGQAIDREYGPVASATESRGDLDSDRVVLVAAPGYGKGLYEQVITVARPLPADDIVLTAPVRLTITMQPALSLS